MTKIIKIALLAILIACTSAVENPVIENKTKVFICVSNSAYAYHRFEMCCGLQRCTHKIIAITVEEAKTTYQRKACRICYK